MQTFAVDMHWFLGFVEKGLLGDFAYYRDSVVMSIIIDIMRKIKVGPEG